MIALDERPRKRAHRPPFVDGNYFDFEEAEPNIAVTDDLLDALYAFICQRADEGDPCRWRCLIEQFGAPYGHDRHAVISFAVDRLKVWRRVKIDTSRIPERILPTREIRPKKSVGDFRFGRLKA